ncbi:MAG: exo-alpha-sialidase [Acidobacteriales bacterium]|nr:exo-alpha-sialidase [Terriglobales bacterium]
MFPTALSRPGKKTGWFFATWFALFFCLTAAAQNNPLVKVSVDKLTNSDSVHQTEVEPATAGWGSTIVSSFHVARRPGTIGWGSGGIGFATSTNAGATWTYGLLPGLTINSGGGTYGAAADPSVAYDAKHGVWLISTLPLAGLNSGSSKIGDVGISRSRDGIHWQKPIIIDKTHLDDKNWTVCDNTSSSPYYGNCYTEWDQAYGSGDVLMSTSSDGGLTWTVGQPSQDHAFGLGGEPLVQPNGTVIVPFSGFSIESFSSTDGGKTWGKSVTISSVQEHGTAGGLRNTNLPTAAMDGSGKAYVAWSDCRFRSGCSANDIVFSTSTDGKTWTAPARIPIDPTTSTVDHFLPGLGADYNSTGDTAHLAVIYYYYPTSQCGSSCKLYAGYTVSEDAGATWTAGAQLAGPMQ